VEQVKRLFLQRRSVQSSFTAADEKMALQLYRTGVSLTLVERAILLGAARKYCGCNATGGQARLSPITARIALGILNSKVPPKPETIVLQPELVVRASTVRNFASRFAPSMNC
jgi:hypothetical protein